MGASTITMQCSNTSERMPGGGGETPRGMALGICAALAPALPSQRLVLQNAYGLSYYAFV